MTDSTRKAVDALNEFKRKLTDAVDILNRTAQNPEASGTSALTSLVGLLDNPLSAGNKLREVLTHIHVEMYTEAQAKLKARYTAEQEALLGRAPKKVKRIKSVKEAA